MVHQTVYVAPLPPGRVATLLRVQPAYFHVQGVRCGCEWSNRLTQQDNGLCECCQLFADKAVIAVLLQPQQATHTVHTAVGVQQAASLPEPGCGRDNATHVQLMRAPVRSGATTLFTQTTYSVHATQDHTSTERTRAAHSLWQLVHQLRRHRAACTLDTTPMPAAPLAVSHPFPSHPFQQEASTSHRVQGGSCQGVAEPCSCVPPWLQPQPLQLAGSRHIQPGTNNT